MAKMKTYEAIVEFKADESGQCFDWNEIGLIVRCKDCKWWMPNGRETSASIPAIGACGYKKWLGQLTMPCEFCFWGERKDDETDS